MTRCSQGLLAALTVVALGGCLEGPEVDAERSLDEALVTTIDVGPGHTIKVYEPAPGEVIYEELAAPGVETLALDLGQAETVAHFHARVAPERPLPAAIASLDRRERSRLAAGPVLADDEAALADGEEPAPSHTRAPRDAARNVQLFEVNECALPGEKDIDSGIQTVDWGHCWTDRTGGSYAWSTQLHAAQAAVRPYRGSITHKVSYDFGDGVKVQALVNVPEGGTSRWWRWNSTKKFMFRSDVSNASGDAYHHAVFGSYSKNGTVLGCYDDGYHCGLGLIIQY